MTTDEIKVNRELDAEIATKVFGYNLDYEFADEMGAPCVPDLRDQYDEWGMLPNYSTDIADAWEVFTHCRNQIFSKRQAFFIELGKLLQSRGNFVAAFPGCMMFLTPEIICKAALAAIG
jgi:hypothetical protein